MKNVNIDSRSSHSEGATVAEPTLTRWSRRGRQFSNVAQQHNASLFGVVHLKKDDGPVSES